MKTTVKLSYSILSAWSRGQYEQAVGMYLGQPLPPTSQMELGKLTHEIWEGYITREGKLPAELGGIELVNPILEQKYRKRFSFGDDMDIVLSGVPDCSSDDKDGRIVIDEFKCGMTKAISYINTLQLDYYKLLLPKAAWGAYRCFNPYTHELTVGIKFLGPDSVERALEHLMSNAGEMIDYLQANKLLINYEGG